MASTQPGAPSTSVSLKCHEKLLDTIRLGSETEAIALFCDEGYDVNTKILYTFDDRKKYLVTPLAWAVRYNRPQLCRYLLQSGAEPYSTLVYDYYPLHEACNRGLDDIVKIFIDMKCDINRVTGDNHSPLHIACMRGNIECARLLLESGANREVRNNNGRTPLELGIYHGQSDLHRLFSYYCSDPKPRIQRRHSLHSPTSEPRHGPMKQLASFDSGSYRPKSMLIDFTRDKDTNKTLGSGSSLNNENMNRVRSQSNQNLALDSGFSRSTFAAQPHTCAGLFAPTTSQLQVSFAPISPVMSISSDSIGGPPSLMKQFSHASSCAADSPSPVERDGVLSGGVKTVMADSSSQPVEVHCRLKADNVCASSGNDRHTLSQEKLPKRKTDQSFLGSSLRSSLPYHSKMAPLHSNSNPEFPLTAHLSMNQADRTHSFDDLYEQQSHSQSTAKAKVSPSREKINSLSSQIYSSLDQNLKTLTQHVLKGSGGSPTEANPLCEVMQKIILVTTPLLHLNQAHIQTLMHLSAACRHESSQDELLGVHSALNSVTVSPSSLPEEETVYDSPVAYLLSIGYRMVEEPLTVMFGVPCDGYMTLTFRLIDESIPNNSEAMLKVVTKIYNLKNKRESSTYQYSIEDETYPSDTPTAPPLQEICLLSHLGEFPHPNVVQMSTYFKANTNEQYELFAQQMNPEKPKKMYTTADFMIFQSPRLNLKEHLDTLRKTKKFVGNTEVFPEIMVLSVLSQVLLAAGHLIHHQISHCAISASNVLIDERNSNQVILSNLSHAVQLDSRHLDQQDIRQAQLRLKDDINCKLGNRHCVLSPEVVEAVSNSKLESACKQGELVQLFAKNDCYGAARMIYSWFLSSSHPFICQNLVKPYSYGEIPYLTELSPRCNHLLKKLIAYNNKERLSPMKGALTSFVLIFGPGTADVKSEEECYKWLLAETVEFYMRPVLVDSKVRDYTDSLSKLLCLYLTIASVNPKGVWEACKFLNEL